MKTEISNFDWSDWLMFTASNRNIIDLRDEDKYSMSFVFNFRAFLHWTFRKKDFLSENHYRKLKNIRHPTYYFSRNQYFSQQSRVLKHSNIFRTTFSLVQNLATSVSLKWSRLSLLLKPQIYNIVYYYLASALLFVSLSSLSSSRMSSNVLSSMITITSFLEEDNS